MTLVTAAVTADEAAVPTLLAAELLADIYDATVDVVHVRTAGVDDHPLPDAFSAVPVRLLDGEVVDVLTHELNRDDVVACVIGTKARPDAAAPTGHVALGLLARSDKPVGLVPPGWEVGSSGRLRILVPLDGTKEADLTVRAVLTRIAHAAVDLVVLHVFDPTTVPAFLDRPEYDLPAWSHEFLQRHCDEQGASVTWRTGQPGAGILDALASEDIDALVLGWHGVLESGRAAVVREVLATAGVPILLVPRGQAERTLAAGPRAAAGRGS